MMHELVPNYVVPCRKTIKAHIKRLYEDKKAQVIGNMEGQYVTLTTDHWTSLGNQAYMTVTAHYINVDWELRSAVLQTVLMPERHTGTNIATRLENCVDEFQIPKNNVVAVVRDGAANMGAAMGQLHERGLDWKSVECVGHTLQLAVKAGIHLSSFEDMLSKCHKLVGHFKHSTQATHHLKKRQEEESTTDPYLVLKQDCKTRWNSTFMMLDRLLYLRWPISKVTTITI